MRRIVRLAPPVANPPARPLRDRRQYDAQRPWRHKDGHFWVGLMAGVSLLALGMNIATSLLAPGFTLVWQTVPPLDRLLTPLYALTFMYSGVMLLLDGAAVLQRRWQRYWLAWVPGALSITWIIGYSLLAMVYQQERPAATFSAYFGAWLGVILFLGLGPEIRDRADTGLSG